MKMITAQITGCKKFFYKKRKAFQLYGITKASKNGTSLVRLVRTFFSLLMFLEHEIYSSSFDASRWADKWVRIFLYTTWKNLLFVCALRVTKNWGFTTNCDATSFLCCVVQFWFSYLYSQDKSVPREESIGIWLLSKNIPLARPQIFNKSDQPN
jgi:hypothetical protein